MIAPPLQDELGYVEEKIIQNFSNYSAWHFRTMLLHQIYGTPGQAAQRGLCAWGLCAWGVCVWDRVHEYSPAAGWLVACPPRHA